MVMEKPREMEMVMTLARLDLEASGLVMQHEARHPSMRA